MSQTSDDINLIKELVQATEEKARSYQALIEITKASDVRFGEIRDQLDRLEQSDALVLSYLAMLISKEPEHETAGLRTQLMNRLFIDQANSLLSLDELREYTFTIGLTLDDFSGQTKRRKLISLLHYLNKRHQQKDFERWLQEKYPHVEIIPLYHKGE